MEENKLQEGFTFGKDEKLCSQKVIDKLFKEGSSFVAYPLRVVYLLDKEEEENKQYPNILISVSKRKFKRANKRNRVKRLVREAYRHHKHPLCLFCKEKEVSMNIAFLYLKSELPSYQEIEKSIQKTITVLQEKEANR